MSSIPQYYNSKTQLAEYQQYTADYFSGCSVNLFFGDQFIDEIVAIEFELQEQMLPVYGYASYTYDAICHGQRLVTGTFKINFVESGYLLNVMSKIKANDEKDTSELNDVSLIENLTSEGFISRYKDATHDNLKAFSGAYEKAIWGAENNFPVKKDGNVPYFNTADEANDIKFDILISYSPGIHSGTVQRTSNGGLNTNAAFTIESLNDVHIFSQSKIIDPSGQPIQEVYRFMAKDWNNKINK